MEKELEGGDEGEWLQEEDEDVEDDKADEDMDGEEDETEEDDFEQNEDELERDEDQRLPELLKSLRVRAHEWCDGAEVEEGFIEIILFVCLFIFHFYGRQWHRLPICFNFWFDK